MITLYLYVSRQGRTDRSSGHDSETHVERFLIQENKKA